MSIRCKHCDSRLPVWEEVQGCCPSCYEEYERLNAHSREDEEEEEYV